MTRKLIEVLTVPHAAQRYATWADWEMGDENEMTITVSQVGDWRYEYLSAIHELVEAIVCKHQGISQKQVDDFDIDYEDRRMKGKRYAKCGCEITDDPGSDVHAPYKGPHHVAELVEYGLAKLLGVDPNLYDAAFVALDGGVAGNRK